MSILCMLNGSDRRLDDEHLHTEQKQTNKHRQQVLDNYTLAQAVQYRLSDLASRQTLFSVIRGLAVRSSPCSRFELLVRKSDAQ